jgi:drug/metabolite transporter (DMT)-like permease
LFTGGELSAVLYGLVSAAAWGAGDYTGGAATRRMNALAVVAVSHLLGLVLLLGLALLSGESLPSTTDLLWGAGAGLTGAVGLGALYQALAVGKAGVAAPITSVVAASLPIAWSFLTLGLPSGQIIVGLLLGLVGVLLVSQSGGASGDRAGVGLAVIGGLGFGVFYVLIGQFSEGAVFYPLVAARCASALSTLGLVLLLRRSLLPPNRAAFGMLALAGALDVGGNLFYALAAQAGRVDVAAVVASLYPAVTILLSWLLRGERIARLQGVGIGLGLVAVALISAG